MCAFVWLCVLRGCCGDLVVMAANGGRWDAACGLACVDDDRGYVAARAVLGVWQAAVLLRCVYAGGCGGIVCVCACVCEQWVFVQVCVWG